MMTILAEFEEDEDALKKLNVDRYGRPVSAAGVLRDEMYPAPLKAPDF